MQAVQLILSAHEHGGGEVNGNGLYRVAASPLWGDYWSSTPPKSHTVCLEAQQLFSVNWQPGLLVCMCLSAVLAKYHVDQWTDLNETHKNQSFTIFSGQFHSRWPPQLSDFSKHKMAATR